jgi:addiction module RelE/StbE family toxin
MAEIVWTETAVRDLDVIADYIALDKPQAARAFVAEVLARVERLARHPKLGSVPQELRGMPYRQLVIPPCRLFYRVEGRKIYIVHVMRGERLLRLEDLG